MSYSQWGILREIGLLVGWMITGNTLFTLRWHFKLAIHIKPKELENCKNTKWIKSKQNHGENKDVTSTINK